MLISEEQVAALEAQVAELLGLLELLDEEGGAEGIRRYAEQVGRIGWEADDAGFPGLGTVCRWFQDQLAGLSIDGRDLSDVERERLEEWPILVMGYLADPTDPVASEPLIEHLSNPVWSTPLAAEKAEALRAPLAGKTLVVAVKPSPLAETVAGEPIGVAVEEVAAASAIPVTEPVAPAPARGGVGATGSKEGVCCCLLHDFSMLPR
jgi:hypothetical protein